METNFKGVSEGLNSKKLFVAQPWWVAVLGIPLTNSSIIKVFIHIITDYTILLDADKHAEICFVLENLHFVLEIFLNCS